MTRAGFDRVLLVGFMGSGKSTVGRLLAEELGWDFIDFDDEIERRAGLSVSEIFERFGEARFRVLESEAAEALLGRVDVVLASGGGWAAAPGRLDAVPDRTAVVWLQVDAAEAVRRSAAGGGRRPLLETDDPLGRARALLEARTVHYAAAGWRVDTNGSSVEDVTASVLRMLVHNRMDTQPE